MEERFSRQNTWFRFRLLTDNGKTVLGTNLKDDESMLKAVWNVSYFSFTLQGVNIYEDVLYYDPESGEDSSAADANPEEDAAPPVKLVLEYGVPAQIDDSIQDEFTEIWTIWEDNRANFDIYQIGRAHV